MARIVVGPSAFQNDCIGFARDGGDRDLNNFHRRALEQERFTRLLSLKASLDCSLSTGWGDTGVMDIGRSKANETVPGVSVHDQTSAKLPPNLPAQLNAHSLLTYIRVDCGIKQT